jgi:hypothetical protein
MRSVDHSFEDLFRGIGIGPIQFVEERRSWQGSILSFSISATMGFVSTPIKRHGRSCRQDIIIDADLGLLERLIPVAKARASITSTVRRLLT